MIVLVDDGVLSDLNGTDKLGIPRSEGGHPVVKYSMMPGLN